jgi:hypothetical protein
MNLPQNGLSLVGTIKLPLPAAFIVGKPIGTQFSSIQPAVFTSFFVIVPKASWLWKERLLLGCYCA